MNNVLTLIMKITTPTLHTHLPTHTLLRIGNDYD